MASLSLFFRLYVVCLSPFYKSYVDTFSPASCLIAIHYTSGWLLFLYFTSSTKRWQVYLYFSGYMWRVYLYFTNLMWTFSLQHPTLCLFIILQSGNFFSILPYQTIGGWFFSILCLICGKFFSIILIGSLSTKF